jgi:replication factor A1
MLQEQDEAKYNVVMHKANSTTFNFACRAKQDTYNVGDKLAACIVMLMPLSTGTSSRTVWNFTDLAPGLS